MNLRVSSILILLTIAFAATGQAPLGINYQGVARAADGSPIINKAIALRISVTNGPQGSTDYVEEHIVETNDFGLFSLVVGNGRSSGNLNDVDWLQGNKWLEIELDANAGTDYILVGSQQLMSVPYALYSAKSGDDLNPGVGIEISNGQVSNTLPDQIISLNGADATSVTGTYPNFTIQSTDEVDDADSDPVNEIQSISKTGSLVTLSKGGGSFTDATADADADPANEIQTIAKVGSTVTLSGGGFFTDAVNDADSNPTNEIQSLSLATNTLSLTSGGSVDMNPYLDNTDNQNLTSSSSGTTRTINIDNGTSTLIDVADNDNSVSNEIQVLSKTVNTVSLSNGGGSFTDAVNDADSNPTNEIQSLSLATNTLSLTSGGSVDMNPYLDNTDNQNLTSSSSGTTRTINIDDGTSTLIDVADNDNSVSNEIQVLSKTANTVSLSNGGGSFTDAVNDADSNPTNEIQSLSLATNTLSLTSGGSVDMNPYLDNTDNQNLSSSSSGTTRTINIDDGTSTLIDVADNDNSVSNEIQVLSKTANTVSLSNGGGSFTDAVNDADSNSANELNVSGSYQPNNTIRITDPGGNVDIPVGTLNANLNANSNRLTNVGDPVSAGDAINLGYLETKDATDYAFKSLITESGTGAALTFNLTGFDFDEGNLIAIDQVQVTESGVYLFNVKGLSTANAPIVINVNSTTDYNVGLINVNRYSDTILLKLTAGDIIELRANSTTAGESFSLEFFGYKI